MQRAAPESRPHRVDPHETARSTRRVLQAQHEACVAGSGGLHHAPIKSTRTTRPRNMGRPRGAKAALCRAQPETTPSFWRGKGGGTDLV